MIMNRYGSQNKGEMRENIKYYYAFFIRQILSGARHRKDGKVQRCVVRV